ncbi:PaaX family transcriptional regulator [Corynebacterium sp. YIM 101645]|uniref:PaaX family transcriptional regulator n=1 Tax=Corynebacterium lemuris TaxID=1859292 RepID=A0ABT2FZN0_9CORY|nr:PaaX family transcriptional regulator C-terminal domain-containing protein [Corynebacterium lemuris]MCS5480700.1 PaaX family transcriptional regulator [Corynebacterium lemuris]
MSIGEAMRTRELVMDLYGDYLRYLGGEARLAVLTELLGVFDIEPATARVTLSRMKREGWFETRRYGREIAYLASGKMMNTLDEGRSRIFEPAIAPWGGRWTMLQMTTPPTGKEERQKFQRMLSWRGFAQLHETTWISPREGREEIIRSCSRRGWKADVFTFWTGDLDRDRELAERCWDLTDLHEGYGRFVEAWELWSRRDLTEVSGDEALRARVLLVHEYRGHLFSDPLLPRALCPAGYAGAEAFRVFVDIHQRLSDLATVRVSDLVFPEGEGM